MRETTPCEGYAGKAASHPDNAAPRGMRRANRQITDADELRRLVESCQVLRIGAQDAEGLFIVPVNFGYEWLPCADGTEALALWIHSAGAGRKAEAFSAGGQAGVPVAIEMDRDDGNISGDYACAWSRAYESIMGAGRIAPVTDRTQKEHGLALIMDHAAPGAPHAFSPEAVERVAIFRIEVEHLTGKRREAKA